MDVFQEEILLGYRYFYHEIDVFLEENGLVDHKMDAFPDKNGLVDHINWPKWIFLSLNGCFSRRNLMFFFLRRKLTDEVIMMWIFLS